MRPKWKKETHIDADKLAARDIIGWTEQGLTDSGEGHLTGIWSSSGSATSGPGKSGHAKLMAVAVR